MRRTRFVETRRDRLAFVQEAGVRRVSLFSVLAGVMCAFGTFVLLLGVVAAIAQWIDGGDGYLVHDWRRVHAAGPIAAVVAVLFVSYLFGGYAAGRMARRAARNCFSSG